VVVHEKSRVSPAKLHFPLRLHFSRKVRPPRFHGKVEFEDVHFAYPNNPMKPILRGVTFTVEPGQKVAFVGSTGCGKSTVMSLLLRLYSPQSGTIKIDGRPIEDYDIHFLRSRVVIVDQHTVLFRRSLRDNIIYGMDREASDLEVERACRDARAWDFVQEKPEGLMTEVATGSANLSGGQTQRIAIARAMVRKPDVILLDEATSALDSQSEGVVQEGLDRLARQGSALVIAHRLTTIRDSDNIVVFHNGLILEQGTHEELLRADRLSRTASRDEMCRSRMPGNAPPQRRSRSSGPFWQPLLPAPLRFGTSRARSTSCRMSWKEPRQPRHNYRSLWDASNDTAQKNMATPKQLQEKIVQLKCEVTALELKLAQTTESRYLPGLHYPTTPLRPPGADRQNARFFSKSSGAIVEGASPTH